MTISTSKETKLGSFTGRTKVTDSAASPVPPISHELAAFLPQFRHTPLRTISLAIVSTPSITSSIAETAHSAALPSSSSSGNGGRYTGVFSLL